MPDIRNSGVFGKGRSGDDSEGKCETKDAKHSHDLQPGKSFATRRLRNRYDYADWLTDVLDALGIDRASIVGCSFGGFLALNQASLAPNRVDRVVMISPVGTFASQFWKLTWSARVKRPIVRLVRRLTGRARAPSMADLGIRPPRDTLWSALMAATMSTVSKLSIITPAVLGSRELRAEMLALAQRKMPNLEGAIVPGADHVAAMAQPDDVNDRIVSFLQN